MKDETIQAWRTVVDAEDAYFRAVAALPRDELSMILSEALSDVSGRRTALRLLEGSTPELVGEVMPAMWPWLETAHQLLPLARRVLAVMPESWVVDSLAERIDLALAGPELNADRLARLAELASSYGRKDLVARIATAVAGHPDPDVAQVAEDLA